MVLFSKIQSNWSFPKVLSHLFFSEFLVSSPFLWGAVKQLIHLQLNTIEEIFEYH